jgi:hypothetical protein
MKNVNYFNRNGLTLSELNMKARLFSTYAERDIEALAEVGYTTELLADLKHASEQFWNTGEDMLDRAIISSEIEKRDKIAEQLKRQLRIVITSFRSVYPDGNSFTRVFERAAMYKMRNAELATLGKNVLQFINMYKHDFSGHSVVTESFLSNLEGLIDEFTWSILSADVQQSVRLGNTYYRHFAADELYKQMQLLSMFGKVAFSYNEPMKYNDYIIESGAGSSPQDENPESDSEMADEMQEYISGDTGEADELIS